MTLPDERYRAMLWAKQLMINLQQPGNRVPKQFKDQARSALRHYPSDWDMKQLEQAAPHVLEERMEEVSKMFKQYEANKYA